MLKSLLSVLVVVSMSFSYGQRVIDTVKIDGKTALMYANRTWEFLEDREFEGLMNEEIQRIVNEEQKLGYIRTWDNDVCYTSNRANDLSLLKDTIWVCVEDSLNGEFVMPFDGQVTSRYGWRRGRYHNGTDIDLETGDTVRSAWSGRVRYAKYNKSGFGNLVIVRHYNGLETFYAHLDRIDVVPNQEVLAGDMLGTGGNTGRSYGSHLHFEVRFYDAPLDPEHIIDFKKKEVRSANLFLHSKLFRPGARATENSGNSTTSSGGKKYYRIRSGDTLSRIAARNRTTVSRLCQLNGIRATTTLQIGRNLRIR